MEVIRGNKTLSGTWGELWINGEKIFEFSKIEMKVTANREDVQLGIDVDSKITGLKGEGSYTVKKVYTRAKEILENWKKGMDVRAEVIAICSSVGGLASTVRIAIDTSPVPSLGVSTFAFPTMTLPSASVASFAHLT